MHVDLGVYLRIEESGNGVQMIDLIAVLRCEAQQIPKGNQLTDWCVGFIEVDTADLLISLDYKMSLVSDCTVRILLCLLYPSAAYRLLPLVLVTGEKVLFSINEAYSLRIASFHCLFSELFNASL